MIDFVARVHRSGYLMTHTSARGILTASDVSSFRGRYACVPWRYFLGVTSYFLAWKRYNNAATFPAARFVSFVFFVVWTAATATATATTASVTTTSSYVPSLERIVVLRLLAQLSSVYHTVTLERLQVRT